MKNANTHQNNLFKNRYCHSEYARNNIINDFSVEIETYEELLPGKTIRSYASGNRKIDKAFIIFKVLDLNNELVYYPVFSESLGRNLAKRWEIKLPSKMTVFISEGSGKGGSGNNDGSNRKEDNKKMLQLIQFARSMMILHVNEPGPMREPFKKIYTNLETHPKFGVFPSEIKSINTAISNYLSSEVNKENENFSNLQQYIKHLQKYYPSAKLRNFDFEILRSKLHIEYPNEIIVF